MISMAQNPRNDGIMSLDDRVRVLGYLASSYPEKADLGDGTYVTGSIDHDGGFMIVHSGLDSRESDGEAWGFSGTVVNSRSDFYRYSSSGEFKRMQTTKDSDEALGDSILKHVRIPE